AVLGGNATTIARAVVDAGSTDVLVLPCSTAAAADAAAAGLDPVVTSEGLGVVVAPTHDDLAVYEAVGLLEAALDGEVADHLATVREHVAATRTHAVPNGDTRALEADVHALAGELVEAGPGLVSVLAGATVGARRAAKQLTALLRAANPDLETFIVVGGQSEPALLVSAQ
ncbi:MAG: hypothetical protein LPK38_02760, partial [Actinomycetes bacterium]|nr:hypothetical protein [Actinomycetes bacterium]MDX5398896.1 hypothetical protein [Actinomycetes bacterium]MDX5449937.1 hypothetical protein [Actinomycetes bacterium]